jgi:hypothetical protein
VDDHDYFPWGGELTEYTSFIHEMLPTTAETGPFGFDVDQAVRFGATKELVHLGQFADSKLLLRTVRQLALPHECRTVASKSLRVAQMRANPILNQTAHNLGTQLKSLANTLTILSIAADEARDSKASSEHHQQDHAVQSMVTIFVPVWHQELLALRTVVTRATEDVATMHFGMEYDSLMTDYAADLAHKLARDVVPKQWALVSPSVRTLQVWMRDVQKRASFLRERIQQVEVDQTGAVLPASKRHADSFILPYDHNFALYFSPRAVVMGFQRWFAALHDMVLDVDNIEFEVKVLQPDQPSPEVEGPSLLVANLNIFAARWDTSFSPPALAEAEGDVEGRFFALPLTLLTAKEKQPPKQNEIFVNLALYRCHLSEYEHHPRERDWVITTLKLPTRKDPDFWLKKSTAVYAMLSDLMG